MKLGRKSIAALVEYLEKKTRKELDHLLFKYDLGSQDTATSKLQLLGNTLYPLVSEETDETKITGALELFQEIAQSVHDIAYPVKKDWGNIGGSNRYIEIYGQLRQALRADGLDLVEGKIASLFSPSVDVAKEEGLLESRLQKFEFRTASNHLEQAIDNAERGNWEASNGQIRTFLDALCNAIASRMYQGTDSSPSGGEARKYLEKEGFLSHIESELLKALFKVLHGEGSHPGTSSSDDCHRRRLMAVAMANYYLERFENRKKGVRNAT